MAKVTANKKLNAPVKEVKEVQASTQLEEEIHTESSDESADDATSGKDDDVVEGLSSDEETNTSTHNIKKLTPKTKTKDNSKKATDMYSGIIYISRLPKGFHERQLSKYFSQFGDLKQVKLARNKKTGNSRHYGFIEFVNKDDAKIAQESMNNYLVLGHLLKVVLMPKDTKIEKLLKYRPSKFSLNTTKKSEEELKKNANIKHELRLNKLSESGIEFKW
ncbi:hypothetical protein TPHA_0B02950 [Tetrapisispora phaffii CBS 4417]|uniref:RRM domain-containing protein n=1 Tax=Tetrapisispora phaffii (strain ATCC 24235 / CBS 4417 / NBRC 1672 / NRRL Y-8282 / UCD 70-5) TaxID=1071381 RepID=G8BPN6_TETPH|nr:hypothetical protein TPHA_0B02950 [Tetrapisispora phaffii CBS 4417]CCE61967.1 hypothetical protein TPHA_0B02950 [Tetrapisispora phaffii CBS 4417]